jgi:hypothetical protein
MSITAWSRMESERAFQRAARGRRRAALLGRLRGCARRLAVYCHAELGASRRERFAEIPLDAIDGTVEPNRAAQFDDGFRPAPSTRARWERVWLAAHRGITLPPVSVLQVGQSYAVRDGHHRVSVAKARGALTITALVAG